MTCQLIDEKIFEYFEGELSKEERISFELHMSTCDACREKVETQKRLLDTLGDMPLEALPEDFNLTLNQKLEEASIEIKKTSSKGWLRAIKQMRLTTRGISTVAVACLVIMFIGTGVFKGLLKDDNMYSSTGESTPGFGQLKETSDQDRLKTEATNIMEGISEPQANIESLNEESSEQNSKEETVDTDNLKKRKLIKTGTIHIEVLDYDKVHSQLSSYVKERGGYIQSSNTSIYNQTIREKQYELRESNLTIRIPQDNFDHIFEHLLTLGNIKGQSQNVEDVSARYRDTENEVKNLEVREQALRKIMENARNVADIIKVEKELSGVRADINQLMGNLKQWDRLVDMSTISIHLLEVKDDVNTIHSIDQNLFTRAKEAFIKTLNRVIKSVENAIVFLIGILPIITLVIIVLLMIYSIIRIRRKKK